MKTLFASVLLSLTLAAPAFATPFSSSVSLDLTTLTFSGVPVSLSLVIPRDPLDPTRGLIEVEQRETFLSSDGIGLGHSFLSPTRIDGATTETLPGVGAVTASGSPTELSSSIDRLTAGVASSLIAHNALLTAHETGAFTVSVDYGLSHSGFSGDNPNFFSNGRAALVVGRFDDPQQQIDSRDFHVGVGSGSLFNAPLKEHGTLSTTYFFQSGQSTLFEVFTTTHASVPVPAMLWPTLIGMIGLAGLVAWRRQHAV